MRIGTVLQFWRYPVKCMIWIAFASVCAGCASPTPSPVGAIDSTEGVASGHPMVAPDSTSAEAAAAVLREYYDAIASRDYRRAYRLWESDGAASGKTYQQFATGFAGTARVALTLGRLGAIGAAAGSRYVEIPVVVRAVTRQGDEQRFQGNYVLRRAEVDGATDTQRHWHIYSAKVGRATNP